MMVLRLARPSELPAINQVISKAVMSWALPERVKRLSLADYCYTSYDWDEYQFVVLEKDHNKLVAVCALTPAEMNETPSAAILIHGLYVTPIWQHQGLGKQLLDHAVQTARQQGFTGLLVKAHLEAQGFFRQAGFQLLPVQDIKHDYPYRYWLEL